MKFHIYGKQYVALRHGQVYFEDKTQNSVALRKEQFFNLSDVIQCLDYFHLQSYPLSEKCWFHVGHYDISLSTQYSTFVFHPEAWKKYLRQHHSVIHFILINGECESYKRNAKHAFDQNLQPRRPASYVGWKALSRSTRNVVTPHEQRSQHTTLSARNRSNSRSPLSRCGRENATRASTTSSDSNFYPVSDLEYSDQCSIEEGPLSTETCTQ